MIIRFDDARREMGKALRKDKELWQADIRAISATLHKRQKEWMEADGDLYATFEECAKLAEEILRIMFGERKCTMRLNDKTKPADSLCTHVYLSSINKDDKGNFRGQCSLTGQPCPAERYRNVKEWALCPEAPRWMQSLMKLPFQVDSLEKKIGILERRIDCLENPIKAISTPDPPGLLPKEWMDKGGYNEKPSYPRPSDTSGPDLPDPIIIKEGDEK